jgi:hypothetical protein
MTEYIIKKVGNEYNVYRLDGKHEILEKIYEFLYEVETYITLKNGIIKEFIQYELENERT